jgi:phosphatidylglycerol:prolipoprotein diacylglycerol transferase
MPFPDFNPVALSIGPFDLRWYGLAYLVGILLGMFLGRRYAARYPEYGVRPGDLEDFTFWATIGVIVGGRLGSVLFYNLPQYLENPIEIFMMSRGGMSFHGGFLGVLVAAVLFCRRRGLPLLGLADILAAVAPIGLFLGRIANFINGELWGRPTEAPWGIVFPGAGPQARHPSQLYEAALEGLLLFAVLNLLIRSPGVRQRRGLLAGLFVGGYGLLRALVELTREPDATLILGLTRGQFYSLPMILLGGVLIWRALAVGSGRPPRAETDLSGARPS